MLSHPILRARARCRALLRPRLASRDGVSLSLKVRDLVREALEIEEDLVLGALAEKRDRSAAARKPEPPGGAGHYRVITEGTRILFVEREGGIVMLPVTKERIRRLRKTT